MPSRTPYGVLGVFVLLLGAGVVLDGSWTARGTILMLAGAALLVLAGRQP